MPTVDEIINVNMLKVPWKEKKNTNASRYCNANSTRTDMGSPSFIAAYNRQMAQVALGEVRLRAAGHYSAGRRSEPTCLTACGGLTAWPHADQHGYCIQHTVLLCLTHWHTYILIHTYTYILSPTHTPLIVWLTHKCTYILLRTDTHTYSLTDTHIYLHTAPTDTHL